MTVKNSSLPIKFYNFRLQVNQIRRLHVELLILLLQHSQVLFQLHLFLHRDLTLHPRQSFLLSLLGNLTFEALSINSLLQHRNFVFVESLNVVNHRCLLPLFTFLSFSKLTLFFQQFIFLKVRSQFIHFLAKSHLLGISFVHQRLLLVQQLLLKLTLSQVLELHLSGLLAFDTFMLLLFVTNFIFGDMFLSP